MTKTTKVPAAVLNAIAFVAETGNWPSCLRHETRWAAQRLGVEFDLAACETFLGGGEYRPYSVTAEGRELAATGPLGKCIAWAKERGFEVQTESFRKGRKAKPNFIRILNRETGVEGFISGGERVFLPEEGSRYKSELVFDVRKRRPRSR